MAAVILLILALVSLMPALTALASANLVSGYKLDDPPGSTKIHDSSPNHNVGLCGGPYLGRVAGCALLGVTGVTGTAASFDGQTDFYLINNHIGSDFTVVAWILTTDVGGTGAAYQGKGIIWSDVAGAASDMIPMALVGNQLGFGTGEGNGASYDTLLSPGAVNTGQWTQVVVTRQQSTGVKRMIINGLLVAKSKATTATLTANPKIAIGANPLDGRYFTGEIDDIQMYASVLSDGEIGDLYTASPHH
jgi:hypothetical protein